MTSLKIVYGENSNLLVDGGTLGNNGRISVNQNKDHISFSINTDIKLGLKENFQTINEQEIKNIILLDDDAEIINLNLTDYFYEINWNVTLASKYYEEVLVIDCNKKD